MKSFQTTLFLVNIFFPYEKLYKIKLNEKIDPKGKENRKFVSSPEDLCWKKKCSFLKRRAHFTSKFRNFFVSRFASHLRVTVRAHCFHSKSTTINIWTIIYFQIMVPHSFRSFTSTKVSPCIKEKRVTKLTQSQLYVTLIYNKCTRAETGIYS